MHLFFSEMRYCLFVLEEEQKIRIIECFELQKFGLFESVLLETLKED